MSMSIYIETEFDKNPTFIHEKSKLNTQQIKSKMVLPESE